VFWIIYGWGCCRVSVQRDEREPFTSRRLGVSNDAEAGSLGGRCEMPTTEDRVNEAETVWWQAKQRGDDNIVKTKHRTTLHCSQIPDISEQRKTDQTLRSRSKSIHHTPRQTHPRKLHCTALSAPPLVLVITYLPARRHRRNIASGRFLSRGLEGSGHTITSPPPVQSEPLSIAARECRVTSETRSSPPIWPPQATTTSTPS
jgi:hypothetical protein